MNHVNQVSPTNLAYRAEIDGLRAVAVIGVILYHAQMILFGRNWFEGGYIGVDIFFVISGYLITRIILFELQSAGSFSFLNFYERRARRILPILFVVIFVSVPFAWQMLLPPDFVEYAESILASLFFGSNFFFYFSTTEYGADSALLKPFLHTWSLGVEEQFYLVFPILAIVAFKFFRKHFLTIIVALSLLSLQFAELMEVRDSDLNFYLPFSRFWELAVGSTLAYRELNYKSAEDGFLYRMLPIIGLYMIAHSILFFDGKTPHPSFHTITPILGVALIICFSSKDELVGKILGSKPFVWIGLISYSAYLWHFPIFAFSRMDSDNPTNHDKFGWIVLTLILSIVSYFFIEKPFRSVQRFNRRLLVGILLGSFIFASLGASLIIHKDGYGDRFNLVATTAEEMKYYRQSYWDDYSLFFNKKKERLEDFPISEKVNVYVIGNSWAHDIAVALSSFKDISVQYRGMTGHMCNEFLVTTLGKSHKEFDKWSKRCAKNSARFNNIPINTDIVVIADDIFKLGQYDDKLVRAALLDNLKSLSQKFKGKVLIIKGRPTWKKAGFQLMIDVGAPNYKSNFKVQKEMRQSLSDMRSINEYYRQFYSKLGVNYISLVDAFCGDSLCELFGKRTIYYFDGTHLTREGGLHIREFLREAVLN